MGETSPKTIVFREANYLSWRLLINENYDIGMDLTEIGVNTRNWVDSAQVGLLEPPCECGIELPGSISHRVS